MSSSSDQMRNKAQDLRQDAQDFGRATASAIRSGADHLRDKASDLKSDIQSLGAAARDAASEQAANVRDAASHMYEEGRERASQIYDQGCQQAQRFERRVENTVRERPLQAVLIAAGVGFILGALCVRR